MLVFINSRISTIIKDMRLIISFKSDMRKTGNYSLA